MASTRRRTSSPEHAAIPNMPPSTLRNPEHPANVSLAEILETPITQNPLAEWLQSSGDIHARLALFSSILPDGPGLSSASSPPCSYPRSIRSTAGSSMAPTCVHYASNASAHPPSLYNYSDATPTETSISTGLASQLAGIRLLEDNNGVLEQPQNTRIPVYECAFWFLSCSYVSLDVDQWKEHCLSHFHLEEPPTLVQCPLCDFRYHGDNGRVAWDVRMNHIADVHAVRGETLKTSRPDFGLFQHLWNKRLIDDQDLKELKGGNHNLERLPANYTLTNSRHERDGRRQRTQHIGTSRRTGRR